MIENTDEEQIELLNSRIAELLRERDELRTEFEIVRTASRLFEDAANEWMKRALKAEAALGAKP